MDTLQLVTALVINEKKKRQAEKVIGREVLLFLAQSKRKDLREAVRKLAALSGAEEREIAEMLRKVAVDRIYEVTRGRLGCDCGCDTCDEEEIEAENIPNLLSLDVVQ